MPNFGDMFGDIKSRLGLSGNAQAQQYDEYDDYGDEYDDYDDGYDDGYNDYNNGYSTRGFGNRNMVTTREPRAGASMPRLVSYDEARTSTRFSGGSGGSMSSYRSDAPSRSVGRTMVDSSLPPAMTPEGTAQVSAAASRKRTEGLDSLFSSTSGGSRGDDRRDASRPLSVIGAASGKPAGVYDPYDSANIGGPRHLKVLHPTSYNDVESMASSLRAGDAVVLVLSATRDDLSKRILDFSFGVASAMEASVDCIGNKVFAITCGAALSELERANLRNQGVL